MRVTDNRLYIIFSVKGDFVQRLLEANDLDFRPLEKKLVHLNFRANKCIKYFGGKLIGFVGIGIWVQERSLFSVPKLVSKYLAFK